MLGSSELVLVFLTALTYQRPLSLLHSIHSIDLKKGESLKWFVYIYIYIYIYIYTYMHATLKLATSKLYEKMLKKLLQNLAM